MVITLIKCRYKNLKDMKNNEKMNANIYSSNKQKCMKKVNKLFSRFANFSLTLFVGPLL